MTISCFQTGGNSPAERGLAPEMKSSLKNHTLRTSTKFIIWKSSKKQETFDEVFSARENYVDK